MDNIFEYERRADRLRELTQRVGFALWQIQELEEVAAKYFVLVAQATRGMGEEAARPLIERAQANTFGKTISMLIRSQHMPAALESRFKALLVERNWLAHSSRRSSRKAVYDDQACTTVLMRLDGIADEASLLLHEIGKCVDVFARTHSLSEVKINELAEETLRAWRDADL